MARCQRFDLNCGQPVECAQRAFCLGGFGCNPLQRFIGDDVVDQRTAEQVIEDALDLMGLY